MVYQSISDTEATLSFLLGALLGGELRQAVMFHTTEMERVTLSIDFGRQNSIATECPNSSTLRPESYSLSNLQIWTLRLDTCVCMRLESMSSNSLSILSCPSDSFHCDVIWLFGLAGPGKSTLLNSIAQHFRMLYN
jgi:hypothetical protein